MTTTRGKKRRRWTNLWNNVIISFSSFATFLMSVIFLCWHKKVVCCKMCWTQADEGRRFFFEDIHEESRWWIFCRWRWCGVFFMFVVAHLIDRRNACAILPHFAVTHIKATWCWKYIYTEYIHMHVYTSMHHLHTYRKYTQKHTVQTLLIAGVYCCFQFCSWAWISEGLWVCHLFRQPCVLPFQKTKPFKSQPFLPPHILAFHSAWPLYW